MEKHINTHFEWDEVIPMVMAAYNLFSHIPSKERPYFWRRSINRAAELLEETKRYLGEGGGKLDLTALQNTYQLAAQNVQMAKGRGKEDEFLVPLVFQPEDLVIIRDHMAKVFEPKCKVLFAGFLILSCLKCALVWGKCHERLRVEIFVRVLSSSEVISLILCK